MLESQKQHIKEKLHEYQVTLRKLLNEIPREKIPLLLNNKSSALATGHADVWFCSDGCLVAVKNGFIKEIGYSFFKCFNQSMVELYNQRAKEFFTYYDVISKGVCPGKPLILNSQFSPITNIISIVIPSSDLTNLLPEFSKANDLVEYRKRVTHYIQEHQNFITIYKLKRTSR